MTLLRLSPDSERLRQIAKAHAAGELSTPDYRRIRAEVIDRFVTGEAQEADDDTQPRWLERPKAPATRPEPIADPDPPRARRVWWWLLVVSVIVVAVGSAAAWSDSIPPAKQRNLSPVTSWPELEPMVFKEIVPFTADESAVRLPPDQDLD